MAATAATIALTVLALPLPGVSGRAPLGARPAVAATGIAPVVTAQTPAPLARDVPTGIPVTITFSLGMADLVGLFTLTAGDGALVPADVTASPNRRTWTLTPRAALTLNTGYRATVAVGALSVDGDPLEAPATWTFSTLAPASLATVCLATGSPARPQATEKLTLDARQLRINQRVAAAAVRRANAIERWLAAGIVRDDLCGGAIGVADLGPGIVTGPASRFVAPSRPSPRPLEIVAGGVPGGEIPMTAEQLRINQRISQAAVRRVNALTRRIDGNLTGGDLVNGAVSADKLAPGLAITGLVVGLPATASTTRVVKARSGGGVIRPTVAQLRINQRISAAAVRRANVLSAILAAGLTAANFADGTITAVDLSGEIRPPA